MSIPLTQLPPADPRLVDAIVSQLKSKGIFDQLRKECLADVDTKPAFLNLRQRVDGQVKKFLGTKIWKSDMNKNQLRDGVRKNIQESGILDAGIDAIINQVVNPKIKTLILPYVETTVYAFLQIEQPKREIKDYDIQHQMYIEPPPVYPYGSSMPIPYPQYADNTSALKQVDANNLVNPIHHLPSTIEPVVSSESEISVGGKSPLEQESQTQLTSDVLPMETDAISSEEDDILSRKSPTGNKGKQSEPEDVKMEEDNAVDSFDTARGNSDDVVRAVEKMNLKEDIKTIVESVETKDPDISKASTGLLFDRQSLDSISSNSSGLSFSPPTIKKPSLPQNNDSSQISKSVDKKSDDELRSTQSTPLIDEKSLLNESINSSENSKTWAPYTLPKDLSSAERITIASFGSTNEPTSIIGGTSPVSTDNSQDSIGATKPQESQSSVCVEESLDSKIVKSDKSEGEVTSSSTTSSSPEPSKGLSYVKGKSSQKDDLLSSKKDQSTSKHRSHSRDKDGHKHGRSRSQKRHSRSHSKSKHDDHSSHRDKDKHHRRDKDDDKDRDKYSTPKGHHHGSLSTSSAGKSTPLTDSSKEKKEKSSDQHKSHSSSHSKQSSKDSSRRRDSRHSEKHGHSNKSSSKNELKSESKTSKDSKQGESSTKSKVESNKLKELKSEDSNSSSKSSDESKMKTKENKGIKLDNTFILQLARASKHISKKSKIEVDKNLKEKKNIQSVKEISKPAVGTISDQNLKGKENIQVAKEISKAAVGIGLNSDKNLKGKENLKDRPISKSAVGTISDKNLKGKENIKVVKEISKAAVGMGLNSDKNLKGKENLKDVKEISKSAVGTISDKNLKGKENIKVVKEINKAAVGIGSNSDKNLKGKENLKDVKEISKSAVGTLSDNNIKRKENIKDVQEISKVISAVKTEKSKNKDKEPINKIKISLNNKSSNCEIVNGKEDNKKRNTPKKKIETKSTDSKKKRKIVYDSSSSSSNSSSSDSESNSSFTSDSDSPLRPTKKNKRYSSSSSDSESPLLPIKKNESNSSSTSDSESPLLPMKKKRTMVSSETKVLVTQSYDSDDDNGKIVLKKITIPVFSLEKNENSLKEKKKNILDSNKKTLLMKKKRKMPNNLDIFGNSSDESEFEGFNFALKSIKKCIQPRAKKQPKTPLIEPLLNSDSSDMDVPISQFCKTPKLQAPVHDFEGFGDSCGLDNYDTADQKLKRYLAKFSTTSCSIGLDDIYDAESRDELEDATVFAANTLDVTNPKKYDTPVFSLNRKPIPIVRIEENSVGSFASDNDSGQSSMDTRETAIFSTNDHFNSSETSAKVTENISELNNVTLFTNNNSNSKDLSVQSTSESSIDSISTMGDTYFVPKKQIICNIENSPTHEQSKRKFSECTGSNDTTLLPISKKSRILNAVRSEMEENKVKDSVVVNSYTILTPEEDRTSKDYEVDLTQGVTAYCPLSPASDSSAEDMKSKNQSQVSTVEQLHQ